MRGGLRLVHGGGEEGSGVEPVVERHGGAAGLIDRARRARARLDPGDPVKEILDALIDAAPGLGTDEVVRLVGPVFAHLESWPAPEPRRRADTRLNDDIEVRRAMTDASARSWLAATAALQALEMGPATPMARAIAAGAVALSRGELEGLEWLGAAVRLSRPPAS